MNSKLIDGETKYLEVELVPIRQKDKIFYVSKIKAEHFLEIYTVQPARYDYVKHSQLANSFPDETEYYRHLVNIDLQNVDHKEFQREANYERVKDIRKFIENEEFALFPNTIIANCELINNREEFSINQFNSFDDFKNVDAKPKYLSFLKEDNDNFKLYIPFIKDAVLVIDGQHRLEGLKSSSKGIMESYDLIICFIIGYDRSVIATQFYKINSEQRPVNRSLLLQLAGEFSKGIGEISYLHTVVKLLNELEDSPLFNRIKMLGVTPRDYPEAERKFLTISQAFLVDNLFRFISVSAKKTMYPPIFLKFYKSENQRIEIIKVLARFFTAIKILKPDWNTPTESIISKGMGIGALLKVLNLIFPLIFEELDHDWDRIKKLKVLDYSTYLRGIENVDFSSNGPYGKVGSEGTITRLKENIIISLTHWGMQGSYYDFVSRFSPQIISFSKYLD